MKKIIIGALAIMSIACTTEDIKQSQQTLTKVMNITVADYPASYDNTRAEQQYGKTSWETGDELILHYIERDANQNFKLLTESTHTLTYDGRKWSIDTPITMPNSENNSVCCELNIIYHPGFYYTYNEVWDEYIFKPKDNIDKNIHITSEYLRVYNAVTSIDHKIVFEETKFNDSQDDYISMHGSYSSYILDRTNRIRIHYKPETKINISCLNTMYFDSLYYLEWSDGEYTINTDKNGNAFIFAYWDILENGQTPDYPASLEIRDENGKLLRSVNLPYSGANAPYFSSTTLCYRAQAYSITIPN